MRDKYIGNVYMSVRNPIMLESTVVVVIRESSNRYYYDYCYIAIDKFGEISIHSATKDWLDNRDIFEQLSCQGDYNE